MLFLAGVWIKAIAGVLETLAGLVLPLLNQNTLVSLVVLFTAPELTEDPNDLVANYLRSSTRNFSASTQSFASAYLVIHGLIKVSLAAGLLWGRQMWAYTASMWALVAFIVYQGYLYARAPSPWLIVLTVVASMRIASLPRETRACFQAASRIGPTIRSPRRSAIPPPMTTTSGSTRLMRFPTA